MGHLTLKDVEKMQYDKKQMQFSTDGNVIFNNKCLDDNTPLHVLINEKNFYVCPFCLENSNKYTIENKGLIGCPNCNNRMKMKTLIFSTNCTNEQYARWVYEYRLSGFFKKINFEKWNKKLYELGISYEFWEVYNKLKGEDEEFNKKPEEFNELQLENIIAGLRNCIFDKHMTKQQILNQLKDNNVEFEIKSFDYCFREALKRR